MLYLLPHSWMCFTSKLVCFYYSIDSRYRKKYDLWYIFGNFLSWVNYFFLISNALLVVIKQTDQVIFLWGGGMKRECVGHIFVVLHTWKISLTLTMRFGGFQLRVWGWWARREDCYFSLHGQWCIDALWYYRRWIELIEDFCCHRTKPFQISKWSEGNQFKSASLTALFSVKLKLICWCR